MVTAPHHRVCTGTLVEHTMGPVVCTDECAGQGCSAAPEEHWLVVRCADVVCGCAGDDRSGDPVGGR